MIPAARMGTVQEIADAIVHLCAEGSAYINGVVLPVDGGYLCAGVATTGDIQL